MIKDGFKLPLKNTQVVKTKPVVGFTLMEVIVGLVIIATVFGGLTATFVGVKRYVARANRRLVAANLGRQVLNSLYQYVRADTWNNGTLASSATCNTSIVQVPENLTLDGFTYGSNFYNVTNVTQPASEGGNMQYRQVTVTITYPAN